MPMSLTDEELDALAQRFASRIEQLRRDGTPPSWSRGLNLTVTSLVIAGMLISAGVTLSKVGSVDEQARENRQAIVEVSKDVEAVRVKQLAAEGDAKVINEKLNTILSEIAALKAQVYASRR